MPAADIPRSGNPPSSGPLLHARSNAECEPGHKDVLVRTPSEKYPSSVITGHGPDEGSTDARGVRRDRHRDRPAAAVARAPQRPVDRRPAPARAAVTPSSTPRLHPYAAPAGPAYAADVAEPQQQPSVATPRVAAGALFVDEEGRVLLVRPTYKEHWDIPGGYAEPGESPRTACLREIEEELGASFPVGDLLVVDWAPMENEGDKLLFVFDCGLLDGEGRRRITLGSTEIRECRFVYDEQLDNYVPARLSRRIRVAIRARRSGETVYAEHGHPQS